MGLREKINDNQRYVDAAVYTGLLPMFWLNGLAFTRSTASLTHDALLPIGVLIVVGVIFGMIRPQAWWIVCSFVAIPIACMNGLFFFVLLLKGYLEVFHIIIILVTLASSLIGGFIGKFLRGQYERMRA